MYTQEIKQKMQEKLNPDYESDIHSPGEIENAHVVGATEAMLGRLGVADGLFVEDIPAEVLSSETKQRTERRGTSWF